MDAGKGSKASSRWSSRVEQRHESHRASFPMQYDALPPEIAAGSPYSIEAIPETDSGERIGRRSGAIRHVHGQQHSQFIHLLRCEAAFGDNAGKSLRPTQDKDIGAFAPGLVGGPGARVKHPGAIFKADSVGFNGEHAGEALDAA